MGRTKKRWSYRAGRRPYSVTVEEFEVGSNLYVRVWIPAEQKYRHRSLRHRDRKRAIDTAERMAAQIREGSLEVAREEVTLERLFRLYRQHRTPQKAEATQLEGQRRCAMFLRVLGAKKKPSELTLGEWEKFVQMRRSGAIDGRGNPVASGSRRTVGARTVEADLIWLRAVLNWGAKWRTDKGQYLLQENPARGFPMPREKNPKRPIATRDRLEKLRSASDGVTMHVSWSGQREVRRSYLSELLDIVAGTGRRISAVLKLTYADLRLDAPPHGAIRWPADTDKMGKESLVPISQNVRAAINRILWDRPGFGPMPMFPSPKDRSKPLRYELACTWLTTAEQKAALEKQRGGLWHPYRRMWATERKHLPDVDVAAAGGWSNPLTLKTVYQQADQEGMLAVVVGGGELRETSS